MNEIGEESLNPGNLVLIKLRIEESWNQVSAFVYTIIRCKMEVKGVDNE